MRSFGYFRILTRGWPGLVCRAELRSGSGVGAADLPGLTGLPRLLAKSLPLFVYLLNWDPAGIRRDYKGYITAVANEALKNFDVKAVDKAVEKLCVGLPELLLAPLEAALERMRQVASTIRSDAKSKVGRRRELQALRAGFRS